MNNNAEEGIARVQARAAHEQLTQHNGLHKNHQRNIAYLDERIFIYVFAIAFLVLLFVWMNASSVFILYGSLALVILITSLWGVVRIKRIVRIKEQREFQVRDTQPKSTK